MIRFDNTWFIGGNDAQEERDRMHLSAIREARITAEYRESMAKAAQPRPASRRVALLAAGTATSVELCASCA